METVDRAVFPAARSLFVRFVPLCKFFFVFPAGNLFFVGKNSCKREADTR